MGIKQWNYKRLSEETVDLTEYVATELDEYLAIGISDGNKERLDNDPELRKELEDMKQEYEEITRAYFRKLYNMRERLQRIALDI